MLCLPSRRDAPWGNRGVLSCPGIIRSAWYFPTCWGIPLCRGFAIPKGSAAASAVCRTCRPGETLHGETGGIPMWGHYPLYAVFPGVLGYLPVPRVRHPEGLRRNQHYMLCLSSRHDTPQKTGAFPRAGTIRSAWYFPACWVSSFAESSPSRKAPPQPALHIASAVPARRCTDTFASAHKTGAAAVSARRIYRKPGLPAMSDSPPEGPPRPALYIVPAIPVRVKVHARKPFAWASVSFRRAARAFPMVDHERLSRRRTRPQFVRACGDRSSRTQTRADVDA